MRGTEAMRIAKLVNLGEPGAQIEESIGLSLTPGRWRKR